MDLKTRTLFGLYVALSFCLPIFLGLSFIEAQRSLGVTHHPLLFELNNYAYVFTLPIFLLSLFLGKLLPPKSDGSTRDQGFLILAGIFWVFSILAWLGGSLDFRSFALSLCFGMFCGMIEGLFRSSTISYLAGDSSLTTEAKIELLKQKGSTNLTIVGIVSGVVAGCVIAGFKGLEPVYGSDVGMLGIPLMMYLGFVVMKGLQERSEIWKELAKLYAQSDKDKNLIKAELEELKKQLKQHK